MALSEAELRTKLEIIFRDMYVTDDNIMAVLKIERELLDTIDALRHELAEARKLQPCGHPMARRIERTHEWTGCQQGGDPAEASSTEWVRYCKNCGMEDTCEDPLPPCYECLDCAERERAVQDALAEAARIAWSYYEAGKPDVQFVSSAICNRIRSLAALGKGTK